MRVLALAAAVSGAAVGLMLWPGGRAGQAPQAPAQPGGRDHSQHESGEARTAAADGFAEGADREAAAPDSEEPLAGHDRFATGTVLAQRLVTAQPGAPAQRWRLVRFAREAGRIARVVDHLGRDRGDGRWAILRQEVMWADSLAIGVPGASTAQETADRLRGAGFALVREPSPGDVALELRLPEVTLDAVPTALARVAATLPDLPADPNFVYFPSQTTPPAYRPERFWGLENIEAPAAWSISTGSSAVVVAVIDTGVDITHPDLQANIWVNPGEIAGNGIDDDSNGRVDDVHGWNFVANNGDVSDTEGHGTHVAGTIGAVGENGVAGIAWQVKILPVRAGADTFNEVNSRNALGYVSALRDKGVPVVAVNASWGGGSSSTAFRQQLEAARDRGVLFVAACGNDGANNDTIPFFPASYPVENIISVASIHQGGALSSFSNYGALDVDLAAPGTGILSTLPGGKVGVRDGTSMAAPHVAGAVALLAVANPGMPWNQLRERILASVQPEAALRGKVATGGRLNLRRALAPGTPQVRVAITAPAERVIVLDRAGLPLRLEAAALPDGGITPAASFTWEADGAAGAVAFTHPAAAATGAVFAGSGVYRVRVRARAGVFAAMDEITVVVGTATPAQDGLRAWWRFNESGASALDSSGNGRTGVLTGTSPTSALVGGARLFDGVDDNMRFSTPPLPRLTLSAWVRADGAGPDPFFPRVVHMQEGLLFFGLGQSGSPDGNTNTVKFALDNGLDGRVWHSAPGAVRVGPWYHIAVSYDSTQAGSFPVFYIDGAASLANEQSGTGAAGSPTVASGVGYVGDRGDGRRAWAGAIGDVRIYDRVLAASEVALLAAQDRLQFLAGAELQVADQLPDSSGVAQLVLPAGLALPAEATVSWSTADSSIATISTPALRQAGFATRAPGETTIMAAVAFDGVSFVHSARLAVTGTVVPPKGAYQAMADSGSVRLWFDEAGTTTLLAGGGSLPAVFARGFAINEAGSFAFSSAGGTPVSGRISSAGSLTGSIAGIEFAGARMGASASLAEGLALFGGYLARSDLKAYGVLHGDVLSLAMEGAAAGELLEFNRTEGDRFAAAGGSGAPAAVLAADVFDAFLPGQNEVGDRRVILVREGVPKARRLANLSARGFASSGENVMIAGFHSVRSDTDVLVRAVGPGLVPFGVSGVLARPRLELLGGNVVLAVNEVWHESEDAAALAAAAVRLSAFALGTGETDAALLQRLPAGPFTALISGANGRPGVVLAEAYDASAAPAPEALVNLSARCRVGQGDASLIAGFVIEGEAPQLLLVRAVGPALASFGVKDFLTDPSLVVFEGPTAFAANDDWSSGSAGAVSRLAGVMEATGAFPLPQGSKDAALLLYLPPGSYTAVVHGAGGQEGVALVEVYRVVE